MRSNRLVLLILGLAGLGLAGCNFDEDTTGPAPNDQEQTDDEAIRSLMAEEDDYFGAGEVMSEDPVEVGADGGKQSPSGAPIDSFYFIRRILRRDIHREIHIEIPPDGPALATVSTREDLRGIFRLFYDDPDNIYLPGFIDKRLHANSRHRAVFIRRRLDFDNGQLDDRDHRGWRLFKVSGAEIVSEPTTKDILSLEIISSSVNKIITDPLELVPIRELPTFQPGEEVTLKVMTSDETDFVFLHTGRGKDEFNPVGGALFEGTWVVGDRRGHRRIGVDVIDRETLFDDEAPYDSVIWVLHYRVAGERIGDFAEE
jgi:hypothetical protein